MTPCILQRSGIGPKALLEPFSIPVMSDLSVGDKGVSHVAAVAGVLSEPLSTGNIRITSKNPKIQPHTIPNYFANPTDYVMMREIVRKGYALVTALEMSAVLDPPLNIDKETISSDEKLNAAIEPSSASASERIARSLRDSVNVESGPKRDSRL